jgi:antitoxin component YwqK of YwqJK toxin-antitoxin module
MNIENILILRSLFSSRLILVLLFIYPVSVYSQAEYDVRDLIEYDGVLYKKFSSESVSGLVYKLNGESKFYIANMKNGLPKETWLMWINKWEKNKSNVKENGYCGSYIGYDKNGKKRLSGNYSNGQKSGLWIEFSKNKSSKTFLNYENGILIDGAIPTVNDKGHKIKEMVWDRGQLRVIRWYSKEGSVLEKEEYYL